MRRWNGNRRAPLACAYQVILAMQHRLQDVKGQPKEVDGNRVAGYGLVLVVAVFFASGWCEGAVCQLWQVARVMRHCGAGIGHGAERSEASSPSVSARGARGSEALDDEVGSASGLERVLAMWPHKS